MKKTGTRILIFALVVCMLMPLAVACGEKNRKITFDPSFQLVYAADEGEYAHLAALAFREAVKSALGVRPVIVTDEEFNGQVAEGTVLFVGNTTVTDGLTPLEAGIFVFEFHEKGPILRAGDPVTLYLAAKKIAPRWISAEYGHVDGQIKLTSDMCKTFSEMDVGGDRLISVMSQNIRCADDGNGNDIVDRKVRFKQLMEAYQPDLLGTQETTSAWNKIFREDFGEAYGMIGCSREGKNATNGEWNTILYKKERFTPTDSGDIWLTDTPNTPSAIEGAQYKRICTWVILKDKLTDKEIFFANTHLDHLSDEIRGQQAAYLVDFLKNYADRYPLYLTGDFNTGNKSSPYKTITAMLQDSHKSADIDASTVDGTFHGYGKYDPSEIDFCFHNDRSDAISYRILSEQYSGYVSDHYGVISFFTLQ